MGFGVASFAFRSFSLGLGISRSFQAGLGFRDRGVFSGTRFRVLRLEVPGASGAAGFSCTYKGLKNYPYYFGGSLL